MAGAIQVTKLVAQLVADISDFEKKMGKAESLTGKFAKNIASVGKIGLAGFVAIATGVGAVSGALIKLAVDAAPLATIKAAFEGLADAAGTSGDAMLASLQKSSAGMVRNRDLMLSFNKAAQLVSKDFAVRLPEAIQYLGKVSASTGQSMDYLLNSLVVGVGRLSPRILDNLAIQVSLAEATANAAEEFGIEEEAVSKAQQQVGMMNVALEKLAINTAAMPELTGTASAGLAGFRVQIQNAKDDIGLSLVPALGTLMSTLNNLAGQILPKVTGAFQNTIGPAVSVITDRIAVLADVAVQAGQDFVNKFGGKMAQAASNALQWGINITTQLASGLIQGAVNAITAAMNFISGLLSHWLSPGSPPLVAPDIDKWGMETMNEYLRGFTKANFDILEGLQAPLKKVFSALVKAGDMAQEASSKLFAKMSVELAGAVDQFMKTGKIEEGIFARLVEVGGRFGEQLSELARRQFKLAAATKAVAEAEDRLNGARDEQDASQKHLNKVMDEYNDLLASGAPEDVLKVKRDEYELAKLNAKLADREVRDAEKQQEIAKRGLDPLKERANLQERLLQQLTQMTQAVAAGGGGGGGGAPGLGGAGAGLGGAGGIELPGLEMGAGLGAGITGGLEAAFEAAKETISAKLDELLEPFTTKWAEDIQPEIDKMKVSWGVFAESVGRFYNEHIQPVIDGIEKLIPPSLLENIGKAAGMVLVAALAFVVLKLAIAGVGIVLGLLTAPLALLILGIALLMTAWEENWFGIQEITQTAIANLEQWWEDHKESVQARAQLMWNTVLEIWEAFKAAFETAVSLFTSLFEGDWRAFGEKLRVIWDNAWKAIEKIGEDTWKAIKKFFNETDWGSLGKSILKSVAKGITSGLKIIKDAAIAAARAALAAARGFLGIGASGTVTPGVPKPKNALGTPNWRGGLTWVGEDGPELANIPRGSQIMSAPVSLALLEDAIAGGTREIHHHYPVTVNTQATTGTYLQDLALAQSQV